MRKRFFTSIILFTAIASSAFAQQSFPIWPIGKMPNSKGLKLETIDINERITQVSTPEMFAFFPSKEENKGSAVIIFPPGGYQKLTYNIAGFQLAKWFNTMGMSAFVLMYRLPNSPDLFHREIGPLQDAQRAIKLIRANAPKWNIDPNKIGAMGCSAGGHLATLLGTYAGDESIIGDSLDAFQFMPNFIITVSPVITMGEFTHKGSKNNLLGENPTDEMVMRFSNELNVTRSTPHCFMVHAQNDKTSNVNNSLLFYEALIKNRVSASLHIFPSGGHSIALRNNPGSANQWTNLCEEWLKEMEFLP